MEEIKILKLEELKAQVRYNAALIEEGVNRQNYLEMMISYYAGEPVDLAELEACGTRLTQAHDFSAEARAKCDSAVLRLNVAHEIRRIQEEAGLVGAVAEIKSLIKSVEGATIKTWEMPAKNQEHPPEQAQPEGEE